MWTLRLENAMNWTQCGSNRALLIWSCYLPAKTHRTNYMFASKNGEYCPLLGSGLSLNLHQCLHEITRGRERTILTILCGKDVLISDELLDWTHDKVDVLRRRAFRLLPFLIVPVVRPERKTDKGRKALYLRTCHLPKISIITTAKALQIVLNCRKTWSDKLVTRHAGGPLTKPFSWPTAHEAERAFAQPPLFSFSLSPGRWPTSSTRAAAGFFWASPCANKSACVCTSWLRPGRGFWPNEHLGVYPALLINDL